MVRLLKRFPAVLLPLIILSVLAGCQPAAPGEEALLLPTLRPTAALNVDPVQVEPAADATLDEVTRPAETPTPAESPTPDLTRLADLAITPEVNITSPNLSAVSGGSLTLSGRVQLRSDQTLEAAVLTAGGHLVAAAPVEPGDYNTWQATINLPSTFAGQATAQVAIFDAAGESVVQDGKEVVIAPNINQERYLDVYRPALEEPLEAVAGFNLFFDGYAERPVNFRISISILDDGCQRQANRQNYTMRGSGYWQAFIVVPEGVSGPTCAQIYFGDEGMADRREIQLRLDVLPAGDKNAPRVQIGNPPPGGTATAGRILNIYGISAKAPGGRVQLTLMLADGTIAATETAETNRYGYWETGMLIPVELEGEALLRAVVGTADKELGVHELLLTIKNE